MRGAVESELEKCLTALSEFPPPLTKEASTEIMLRVSAFSKDVKDAVLGRKYYNFVQSNRARYENFKSDIEKTAPDFRPSEEFEDIFPHSNSLIRPRGLLYIRNVIKK